MMPSVDIKKITMFFFTASCCVSFLQASDDAYVKSLEKALVEKITHDRGVSASNPSDGAQSGANSVAKNNNMVGAAVVTKLAEARNALLDALSLSEFSSASDGIGRLERGIAAANSFSVCLTMLRSSGAVGATQVAPPMGSPVMMTGIKPMNASGMVPVQKIAAPGMPGAPMMAQPAKPQIPGMIVPVKPVASADEEEDDEEETPAVPAPIVGAMPGVKPLLPAQGAMPGMMPVQAPRPMVPTQPMATMPARPMVPAQPMAMPGMPLALK